MYDTNRYESPQPQHQGQPPTQQQPRRGFNPGAALTAIAFMVLGALFLIDAIDAVSLRRDIVWPAMVITLGITLVLSSLWNRREP